MGREELRRRNAGRGLAERELAEIAGEADALDAARLDHTRVDTDGRGPADIADEVLERTGIRPASSGDGAAGPPRSAPVPPAGRIVWLCGPAAVGKSTIGFAVYQRLLGLRRTVAFADLQQLGFLRPPPADDQDNHGLKAANLTALWATAHAAGAEHLIVVGSVHREEDIERYRHALGAAHLTVCRLRAAEADLRARIAERSRGGGPPLAGDALRDQPAGVLDRALGAALTEQEALTAAGIAELTVDTTGKAVEEAVADIVAATHLS